MICVIWQRKKWRRLSTTTSSWASSRQYYTRRYVSYSAQVSSDTYENDNSPARTIQGLHLICCLRRLYNDSEYCSILDMCTPAVAASSGECGNRMVLCGLVGVPDEQKVGIPQRGERECRHSKGTRKVLCVSDCNRNVRLAMYVYPSGTATSTRCAYETRFQYPCNSSELHCKQVRSFFAQIEKDSRRSIVSAQLNSIVWSTAWENWKEKRDQ